MAECNRRPLTGVAVAAAICNNSIIRGFEEEEARSKLTNRRETGTAGTLLVSLPNTLLRRRLLSQVVLQPLPPARAAGGSNDKGAIGKAETKAQRAAAA